MPSRKERRQGEEEYVVDTIALLPPQFSASATKRSRNNTNTTKTRGDDRGNDDDVHPPDPDAAAACSAALSFVARHVTAAGEDTTPPRRDRCRSSPPSANRSRPPRAALAPYHVGVLLRTYRRRTRLAFVVIVDATEAAEEKVRRPRRCRRGSNDGSTVESGGVFLRCSRAFRVGVRDVLNGGATSRTMMKGGEGGGGDRINHDGVDASQITYAAPPQPAATTTTALLSQGWKRKVDADAEAARRKGPKEPLRYETPNFLVLHPNYPVAEPNPLCEMYLSELYKGFKSEFLEMLRKERLIIVDPATGEDIPQKVAFCTDLLSFFVLQNYSRRSAADVAAGRGHAAVDDNPFFSDDAQYDIKTVLSLVARDLAASEKGAAGGALERFQRVLTALQARSRDYNRVYAQAREALLGTDYTFSVDRDGISGNVNIKLLLVPGTPPPPPGVQVPGCAGPASRPSGRHLAFDDREVSVRNSVFRHLVRSYNIANFQDHGAVDPLDALDFYEKVFILYYRYFTFDSGKNQSSILPAFKMVLKRLLNIKVELFGSAINTSSRFGSLFYDVERYFGSLGNFFDLDVRRGYFEVNPPYEDVIVNAVFRKLTEWLYASTGSSSSSSRKIKERNSVAPADGDVGGEEEPHHPLLFFVVLPKRDYRQMPSFASLAPFVKRYEVVPRDRFPFLRYDRTLTKTRVTPIVDVILLILHNDHIDDINKEIVRTWNSSARFRLRPSSSPSPPPPPRRGASAAGGGGRRRS